MRDPKTAGEWREAVNLAELMLRVDSARQYGLIGGGPWVDPERCSALLKRGAKLGYLPDEAEIDDLLKDIIAGRV